jgi:hypothetical protein
MFSPSLEEVKEIAKNKEKKIVIKPNIVFGFIS